MAEFGDVSFRASKLRLELPDSVVVQQFGTNSSRYLRLNSLLSRGIDREFMNPAVAATEKFGLRIEFRVFVVTSGCIRRVAEGCVAKGLPIAVAAVMIDSLVMNQTVRV